MFVALIKENFLEPELHALGEDVRLVAIDFWATWCGPCRRYSPVFMRMAHDVYRENDKAPAAFVSVDVDRNIELARSFRVKSVPTTVIAARERGLFGAKWKEKARFSGVVAYPDLLKAVEKQIAEL